MRYVCLCINFACIVGDPLLVAIDYAAMCEQHTLHGMAGRLCFGTKVQTLRSILCYVLCYLKLKLCI